MGEKMGEMDEQKKPFLGLATTRELLDELATRMEITQNSTRGRELGQLCREATQNLAKPVLDYTTIKSDG